MQGKSVQEITEELEHGIKELFESDKYRVYLSTMAKFHNYSFTNTLLIAMQKPDASYVAGFQSWKNNFERHVMKGEKGIKILAPTPYKRKVFEEKTDDQGNLILDNKGKPVMEEVEKVIPAFKVVNVFDISQTEGKELPQIVNQLAGNVRDFDDFMKALESIAPVPIEYADIEGSANGFFSPANHFIAIQKGMSEMQTMKTCVHEVAHSILHSAENKDAEDKNQFTKEVEAESVAYTVCQYFGIDTSDYSFGYIAGWSSGKEFPELKESLETIRKTASEMIGSIEEAVKDIQLERTETERDKEMSEEKGRATITVEWSEHVGFKDGKTYSVLEFDTLMKKYDKEWCEGQKRELEQYGSFEAAVESGKAIYQGYSKVKYTINMPEGSIPSSVSERQDIGDGYGGVIDYFKTFPEYMFGNVVNALEMAKEIETQKQEREEIYMNRVETEVNTNTELSLMQQAEKVIDQLEADKTIFSKDERNLIVNYAYKIGDINKTKELAHNLASLKENSPDLAHQAITNAQAEIDVIDTLSDGREIQKQKMHEGPARSEKICKDKPKQSVLQKLYENKIKVDSQPAIEVSEKGEMIR